MIKTFCWVFASAIPLILGMAEVASGRSPYFTSQYPTILPSELDLPVCYIQTPDGQTLDLSKLCINPEQNTTVNPTDIQRLLTTQQCPGCVLQGAKLTDANLRLADLIQANLSGANLSGTTLMFADFSGASLNSADLRGANLYGANLTGANLEGANLQGANLKGAILKGANLKGAIMPDGSIYP